MPDQYGNELITDPPKFANPNDPSLQGVPEVTIKPAHAPATEGAIKNVTGPSVDELLVAVDNGKTARKALAAGATRQQVAEAYSKIKKLSVEEADTKIVEFVADKAREMRDLGFDDNKIRTAMQANRFDPDLSEQAIKLSALDKTWSKYEWKPEEQVQEAKEIYTSYNNIYGKYSDSWKKNVLGMFSPEIAQEARKDINQLNLDIVTRLKEDGFNAFLDPNTGEPAINTGDGLSRPVTSDFLQSLASQEGEFAGGMAGAAWGTAIGAAVGAAGGPFAGITVPAGATAGGFIGGALGTAAGRGADIYINSLELKEQLEEGLYSRQLIEAGAHNAVMEVLGGAVFKAGYHSVKGTWQGFKYLAGGNTSAALKYVKDSLHISDEAANEIVTQWQSMLDHAPTKKKFFSLKGVNQDVPLNKSEIELKAILETQQGAEAILKEAIGDDLRISNSLLKSIDARTKQVYQSLDNLDDPNLSFKLREDYATYVKDVKDAYGYVVDAGSKAIDGTDYSFDVTKLGLKPALEVLQDSVENTASKDKLINIITKIESKTNAREFSDLLDFRKAINEFKYGNKLRVSDKKQVNKVLQTVDSEINKTVRTYMGEGGKTWLNQFKEVKGAYSQMLRMSDEKLYKTWIKNVNTEEKIRASLNQWGTLKDLNVEQINKVMTRVSPYVQSKVQVAALKNAVEKHTIGNAGSFQAVDWPMVAKEIEGLNINTKEAKSVKDIIDNIAKVFKNDAELGKITGRLRSPTGSNYLESDPKSRIKMGVMNQVFDFAKSLLPNEAGKKRSLFKITPKLFENPLDYKKSQEFINMWPKDRKDQMRSLLKELQIQTAKAPKKSQDFVRLYQKSSSGSMRETTGAWGKGKYLSTKILNKQAGDIVVGEEINMSKLATFEDMSRVLSRPITKDNIANMRNMKGFQERLLRAGFIGIKDNDKYMLFPDK